MTCAAVAVGNEDFNIPAVNAVGTWQCEHAESQLRRCGLSFVRWWLELAILGLINGWGHHVSLGTVGANLQRSIVISKWHRDVSKIRKRQQRHGRSMGRSRPVLGYCRRGTRFPARAGRLSCYRRRFCARFGILLPAVSHQTQGRGKPCGSFLLLSWISSRPKIFLGLGLHDFNFSRTRKLSFMENALPWIVTIVTIWAAALVAFPLIGR